jgi:hypothetical protein
MFRFGRQLLPCHWTVTGLTLELFRAEKMILPIEQVGTLKVTVTETVCPGERVLFGVPPIWAVPLVAAAQFTLPWELAVSPKATVQI